MRQERSTYRSVRRVEHPTDWTGEAVNCTEASVGEGKSAEETGNGHVFARNTRWSLGVKILIASRVICNFERPRRASNTFEAEGVGHGIGAARHVWFDELGQRIEARAAGDCRGEVV